MTAAMRADEREDEHRPVGAPDTATDRHPVREEGVAGHDERRDDGQNGDRHGEPPALVRGVRERRELRCQARRLVRPPDGERGPGRDHQERRHELQAARVDGDHDGEARDESDPSASPEREVEHREQQDEARRGERSHHECLARAASPTATTMPTATKTESAFQ